jgi:hypothetical protein
MSNVRCNFLTVYFLFSYHHSFYFYNRLCSLTHLLELLLILYKPHDSIESDSWCSSHPAAAAANQIKRERKKESKQTENDDDDVDGLTLFFSPLQLLLCVYTQSSGKVKFSHKSFAGQSSRMQK